MTHSALGLAASAEIPYGYGVLERVSPVLGSSLSSVSGAPSGPTRLTHTASLEAAIARGMPPTGERAFGRPGRAASLATSPERAIASQTPPKPAALSATPLPTL